MLDPEIGFTSDVIRDPHRFVGRTELIRDCLDALNSPLGLIAIYGKRGVGKSSLLRQIQASLHLATSHSYVRQLQIEKYHFDREPTLQSIMPATL